MNAPAVTPETAAALMMVAACASPLASPAASAVETPTPRPWAVGCPPEKIITNYRDVAGSMTCENYTKNGAAKVIAVCEGRSWMTEGENFANAALIVEAVNAYDALRDALRTLCLQREGHFHTEAAWATARALAGLEPRERSW